MSTIFFDKPANWQTAQRLMQQSWEHRKAEFQGRAAHDTFFSYVITPASGRWAFFSSGKTGTTTVLDALFEVEFGCVCNTVIEDPTDLNKDAALHRTVQAGVFRQLHLRNDVESLGGYLDRCLRIASVRHPTDRAWSSFRYLCRSARLRHGQFSMDRLRMNALVGMDWEHHAMNREGFERFLDYIRISLEAGGEMEVNNHWRPQVLDVRPDLFAPHILARLEDPGSWRRELAERLDNPAPLSERHRNPGEDKTEQLPEWFGQNSIRSRLEAVYGCDYEAFGYR